MYVLHSRLVTPSPCINNTFEMHGNSSMVTSTLYYNPHFPEDDLVVCRSYQTWAHIWGCLGAGWMASPCMCYIRGLSYLTHVPIRHVKYMTTHPWSLVPQITSHTSLGMAWWFKNPAKSSPIMLAICGLDGVHPCVCVTYQACQNFPMHLQDM